MSKSLVVGLFLSACALWPAGAACLGGEIDEGDVTEVPIGVLVELDVSSIYRDIPFEEASWTLDRPAGSTAELSDGTGLSTNFVPDLPGVYEVRLEARDRAAVVNNVLRFLASLDAPRVVDDASAHPGEARHDAERQQPCESTFADLDLPLRGSCE